MKFLILLFFTVSAYANFAPQSKIDGASIKMRVFLNSKKCENFHKEKCVKIPKKYNPKYHELVDEMIPDVTKPIYEAKSDVVACAEVLDDPSTVDVDEAMTQEEDCIAKEASQVCDKSNGYYAVRLEDNSEVYCTKVLGYEDKLSGNKIVKENSTKKASFESSKSLSKAKEGAIKVAFAAMNCGRLVIATLLVQNASKDLKKAQIKAMNKTYRDIKELLETGSLASAREEILASVADGVIVTEADKTALVAQLDSCTPSI